MKDEQCTSRSSFSMLILVSARRGLGQRKGMSLRLSSSRQSHTHQQAAEISASSPPSAQPAASTAFGLTHNLYQSLIQQQQQLPPELQTILSLSLNLRKQQQQQQAQPGSPFAATTSGGSLPSQPSPFTGTLAPTGTDTADTLADLGQLPTPVATARPNCFPANGTGCSPKSSALATPFPRTDAPS